jgi:phosphatidylglycerophosphatase C
VSPPTPRRVTLFDLDGVLTRRDTFATLVSRRLRRSPWRLMAALPALPLLALTTDRPRWRAPVARYLVRVALLGTTIEEARTLAATLGAEFAGTPQWLNMSGIVAAREHLAGGDRVVVVTATEEGLARRLLEDLGLAGAELIASGLSPAVGGVRLRPHNYGQVKVASLRSTNLPRPWTVLYTDSWADAPVMREVERVVLVEPSTGLLRRVHDQLGVTVSTLPSGR